jgi:hypothetical protein
MLSMRRRAALVLLTALLVGGCGGGDDEPAAPKYDTKPLSRSVPVQLEVRTTGNATVQYEAPAELRIVTFRPHKRDLSLLSVGIEGFKPLADGNQFRFSLDVAGRYDGPGRYTIQPSSGPAKPGSDLSNALLMLVQLKDPKLPLGSDNVAGALRFDRPASACTVELDDDRSSGSLNCPKLGDETGQIVDLHITWRATTSQA